MSRVKYTTIDDADEMLHADWEEEHNKIRTFRCWRALTIGRVKYTIIDEADEMLHADWEEELNKIRTFRCWRALTVSRVKYTIIDEDDEMLHAHWEELNKIMACWGKLNNIMTCWVEDLNKIMTCWEELNKIIPCCRAHAPDFIVCIDHCKQYLHRCIAIMAKKRSGKTSQSKGKANKASAAACIAVFGTVELLEQILLLLGPWFTDLYRVQRVCKHWRAVIAGSQALQEEMFLRSPTHSWPGVNREGSLEDEADLPEELQFVTEVKRTLATLSPLIEGCYRLDDSSSAGNVGVKTLEHAVLIPSEHMQHTDSRHRQLLTYPACESIEVEVRFGYFLFEEPVFPRFALTKAGGIRISDVVRGALVALLSHDDPPELRTGTLHQVLRYWRPRLNRILGTVRAYVDVQDVVVPEMKSFRAWADG